MTMNDAAPSIVSAPDRAVVIAVEAVKARNIFLIVPIAKSAGIVIVNAEAELTIIVSLKLLAV
jgi:hypothetical protein